MNGYVYVVDSMHAWMPFLVYVGLAQTMLILFGVVRTCHRDSWRSRAEAQDCPTRAKKIAHGQVDGAATEDLSCSLTVKDLGRDCHRLAGVAACS